MRAESEGKTGVLTKYVGPLRTQAGGIAKPTDGRGTALSQALVSLELDMAIRRALSRMFEPAIRWSNLRASASACMGGLSTGWWRGK